MPTYASIYSGIGGADAGFAGAGWTVAWQCEVDQYRRDVLSARFGVRIYHDVRYLSSPSARDDGTLRPLPWPVDCVYAEFPDHRIGVWWPPVWRVIDSVLPPPWAGAPPPWCIIEMSPTVPCDEVLRDLAIGGWAFRLLHIRFVILAAASGDPTETDIRNRALVIACRDRAAIDAVQLASNFAEIVVQGADTSHERLSLPWHEESRGFKVGYTCVCGVDQCACSSDRRISALADATSPIMGRWLAEIISGRWSDGVTRKTTSADGAKDV